MGHSGSNSMAVQLLSLMLSLGILVPVSLSQSAECKSQKFTTKKTFENCVDLPTLGAALHWTFDSGSSTLSMAFTAKSDGWAAWGLNPESTGMMGTQALIAGKFGGSALSVDTYDVASYHGVVKGPISYNVTGISCEEAADGKITIFGNWVIPKGQSTVNQVWQVGPIVGEKPGKHDSATPNLSATMKLSLAGAPSGSAAPKHEPSATAPASTTSGSPSASGSTKQEVSVPPEKATAGAGEALLSRTTGFGLGLVALLLCFLC